MKIDHILPLLVFAFACTTEKSMTPQELHVYEVEINAWHAKRIEDVKAPNGWVNLVGLYWLEPGINLFGSSDQNNIVFPKGTLPDRAGYFLVKDNMVSIFPDKEVTILSNGAPLTDPQIFHADSATSSQLQYGSLRWNIIKRDDKIGIRLRDLESEALTNFKEVDRFPIDVQWRLEARFEKADSLKTIDITNVLGQTTPQRCPGSIVFEINGQAYRLDALEGGKDELFIIFADATSGKETYGGGRFIYVKKPDAEGKTIIDFNKAYNPPCVFSPYATCPLPPLQNVLPIEIKVGEKNYGLSELK